MNWTGVSLLLASHQVYTHEGLCLEGITSQSPFLYFFGDVQGCLTVVEVQAYRWQLLVLG